MAQTSISIRVDEDIKKDAEALFTKLGLTLSSAANVFFRQAVRTQSIPFPLSAVETTPQTKARKDRVASYLINAAGDSSFTKEVDPTNKQTEDNTKPPYKGIFIDACHRIVSHVFLRYHCLLL